MEKVQRKPEDEVAIKGAETGPETETEGVVSGVLVSYVTGDVTEAVTEAVVQVLAPRGDYSVNIHPRRQPSPHAHLSPQN